MKNMDTHQHVEHQDIIIIMFITSMMNMKVTWQLISLPLAGHQSRSSQEDTWECGGTSHMSSCGRRSRLLSSSHSALTE
ncbi:hypothetical protein EYF80_061167 [Liparis tanakae]|uniref:Uncharacterized protein n=1 Tax=Liparis tanakae TaxID=230148 RepID=A0A4Z2EIM5_9TELE|nr:hypothetical protein EYF80_061167 [Liparis tanakae]